MHIVTAVAPGGPEVLAVREVPDPEPRADEVVIDVVAAGVNNADLLQRAGRYPVPAGAPDWPGLEVSGRVSAVGRDVTRWTVDDEVCALLDGGGYAARVAVAATQVLPAPTGLPLADAAALPEALSTVLSTLDAARLAPGERLLVHGGSGGVGHLAVQVGLALGAWVATTAGSPERARRCRELGADVVVDHRAQDFVAEVLAATEGHGADVVLDVVGAAYLPRNLEVLAAGGRLAVIGMQKGRRGELDLGTLLTKRATVLGTTLRSRPREEKARIVAAVEERLWPRVQDGAVRPVVHARLPLEGAGDAHRLMASGEVFGKVLLEP